MSTPYSGIPLNEKRTWVPPRWLKEGFVAFALVAVLAVGISKAVQHFGGKVERAKSMLEAEDVEPHPAIGFKLDRKGGGSVDLSQLRGKVVLINFWATWCPPCLDEMPSLEKLARRMDPQHFELVAVSVDETWAPVEKFVPKDSRLTVALDPGGKISRSYGTSKFPESYLVDADGNLRLKFVGPRDWTEADVYTVLESFNAPAEAKSVASAQSSPR